MQEVQWLMSNGSRFRKTVVRARRRIGWEEGPFGIIDVTTAVGSAVFPTAQAATTDGLTLVRIRGELAAFLTASNTQLGGWAQVAVGLCIVSENAATIGATAIPDPLVDIAWDGWLYHKLFLMQSIDALTPSEDAGDLGIAVARFDIDNKAMRKMRATDVLVGMVGFGAEVGTATMRLNLATRALFKLP